MIKLVKVHVGRFGNIEVIDKVFPLSKDYRIGKRGGYITVDGSPVSGFPDRNIRILVQPNQFEVIDELQKNVTERDDHTISREIIERFDTLDDMSHACVSGVVRGMIVSGDAGLGKSFGVEKALKSYEILDMMSSRKDKKAQIIKGTISPIGLYIKLYQYSEPGCVLVFDDCDTMLFDQDSLNLLKAALDSGETRIISYNKDSNLLKSEDIPDRFEYKGSVIFITNIDFEHHIERKSKISAHLTALISRCHYVDVQLRTMKEKILRMRDVALNTPMLDNHGFDEQTKMQVLNFVIDNHLKMRELSLRSVIKVADLRAAMPDRWERMARITCMKKNVLFE